MRNDTILPRHWTKLYATNQTDSAFDSIVITDTEPALGADTGVIEPVRGAEVLDLAFFGAGAATNTFDALVFGWNQLRNGTRNVWVPVPIVHYTCTLGTATGLATAGIVATDLLAHTVIVAASGGIGVVASQVAGNRMAKVECGIEGYEKIQVIFDMTGATNGNCIYRTY